MKHALTNIKDDLANGNSSTSSSSKYDIYSDSKYAIQSINEWSEKWQLNGWKTSTGQPVANSDLIKDAVQLKMKLTSCIVNGIGNLWSFITLRVILGMLGMKLLIG